eukprot:CAMPEP_0170539080 /NCGR_PEP_ID=MMETSP0209-20121228/103703_1 /TAXON_ID=665100 ORGANISM="Litonotus pictus, Strain P1" /NCGR_SAMPLE_ID=MMETSP0209 /ASSEMBLY_ACC=CAM_ASM_000301 /LENGTH=379 /DNA_ID=CAMNT_0010840915 /DNA_START=1427 /DNA_END=2563 /DNA_ORIENTATION=-
MPDNSNSNEESSVITTENSEDSSPEAETSSSISNGEDSVSESSTQETVTAEETATSDETTTNDNTIDTNTDEATSPNQENTDQTNPSLRLLQEENSTDTMMDESMDPTTPTVVVPNPRYQFCFIQTKTCPFDVDVKIMEDVLKDLFKENDTSSPSRRVLQQSKSKFQSLLPQNLREEYVGYSFTSPDPNLVTAYMKGIIAQDDSNFKVSNGDVHVQIKIISENENLLFCYFAVSSIPLNSQSTLSQIEIKSCSPSKTIFCGEYTGEVLGKERLFSRFMSKNLFVDVESLTLYTTCKQNLPISNDYSDPLALITIYPVLMNEESSNDVTDVGCTNKSTAFPGCCENGVVEIEDDPGVFQCDSKSEYFDWKMILVLMLLVV